MDGGMTGVALDYGYWFFLWFYTTLLYEKVS
jgi:hypothetical protein